MAQYMLEMKNITKVFPGVKALDEVTLKVKEGEIHAIVGENGAGKSTLMNVLSGVYPYETYTGDIEFNGGECRFHRIKDSEAKGIVIIHQELALVPLLSIGENLFLGNERAKGITINWDETFGKADEYLKLVGLKESSRTLIKDISVGKQQLVEIAKALAKSVKVLILDEPTASLNEKDSKNLLDLLLQLKKQGMTSIIISHKLNEISYVADSITIIRDGSTVCEIEKKGEFNEDVIIKAMVGRELTNRFPQRIPNIGEIMFEVKHWFVHHPLNPERLVCDDINLDVKRGEIVGISGLMGAGRTELAMSIFGKSYGVGIQGETFILGKKVNLKSPQIAIEHKVAYVTEDRKGNGLILPQSVRDNTTLAKLSRISTGKTQRIDKDLEVQLSQEYIDSMGTKCSGQEQPVENLSGGNQQKVLIGKWLFAEPDILFLDEPTRGIDVGAKYEIYKLMNGMADEGKALIMISSELPELLGMCDRIYVMNEGKFVGEIDGKEATQEKIMSMMLKS
ncbi:MAG: sugar ABC transporter ATP-binding protein [Spirochaetaceae bacterium]|nr:sugar ABC transporter ATP-binding protein [Spirochaetaceae bacterium]